MKVLLLALVLLAPTTQCGKNYSVIYRDSELTSSAGMHGVLGRMQEAAHRYCAAHHPTQHLAELRWCRQKIVSALARKVRHRQFREFVDRLQNDEPPYDRPTLI